LPKFIPDSSVMFLNVHVHVHNPHPIWQSK
jgi:hypothetical protein